MPVALWTELWISKVADHNTSRVLVLIADRGHSKTQVTHGQPTAEGYTHNKQAHITSRQSSRRYQIFWEVVGLERGPLSLVSTTEELLDRKVAAPVLKTEITALGISRADYATSLYPQKLALTSPTGSGRSVGIVRSRTQATEFVCFVLWWKKQVAGNFLKRFKV
jgi:hypothetical protein